MTRHSPSVPTRQRGAALLLAMLIVSLVASLSAAALWHQWRGIALESAERERLQSAWILQGALDWARLILREDGRSGGPDHLAEPWAVPLQEARLSSFLGADSSADDTAGLSEVFLSGDIADMQGRLNVRNLVNDDGLHRPTVLAFTRLFEALELPPSQVTQLGTQMQNALSATAAGTTTAPLLPRSVEQLAWLGLPPKTLTSIAPYVVVLPERTTLNINTAPALVLHAAVPGLRLSDAQTWLNARASAHFRAISDAPGGRDAALNEAQLGVTSRFFLVRAQLRNGEQVLEEATLLQREGQQLRVLRRERLRTIPRSTTTP